MIAHLSGHPLSEPGHGGEVCRHGAGGSSVHLYAIPPGACQAARLGSSVLHFIVFHQVRLISKKEKEMFFGLIKSNDHYDVGYVFNF